MKTKICAIGDPHGAFNKIKKIPLDCVNLILITGDLGSANLMRKIAFKDIEREKRKLPKIKYSPMQQKKAFMEAYNSSMKIINYLAVKKKIPVFVIYGNVESTDAETKKISKEIGFRLPFLTKDLKKIKNVMIINNKIIKFNNIKIGGLEYFIDTSWVREFKPAKYRKALKNANNETYKAKKILKKFGKLDILLCHQPPFGVLDKVNNPAAPKHWTGKKAGSKVILDYIEKYQPKYVFCGHIHEGHGFKNIGKTRAYNLGFVNYKIITL